jgi:hypothetical protein
MGVGILTDINGVVPQRAIRYIETMPIFVTYCEEAVDFGAGDNTVVIATPATMRAKPMQVDFYNNSETFNSVTTAARVDIGDGSDADEFALTTDLADGTAAQVKSVHDATITIGDTEIIEPGDQVTVTNVAPTGGTPTGICSTALTMLYFK